MHTLSIGIAAYNEEKNINSILNNLIDQNFRNIKLDKIIVYLDGSTDNSSDEVKKIKSKKIILIDAKKNHGKAYGLNQIISSVNSDCLVLLDADISFDKNFIYKLTKPVFDKKADLTSGGIDPIDEDNFLPKVLCHSFKIKNDIFENYKNGDNVFTCHGAHRAFSKEYYSKLKFKENTCEDSYSYLFCITSGFTYKYVKSARINLKLPTNLDDHKKQSQRFFTSIQVLYKHFNPQFIKNAFSFPKIIFAKQLTKWLIKSPVLTVSYLFLTIWMILESKFKNGRTDVWAPSITTKTLS